MRLHSGTKHGCKVSVRRNVTLGRSQSILTIETVVHSVRHSQSALLIFFPVIAQNSASELESSARTGKSTSLLRLIRRGGEWGPCFVTP
eukprot:scaffold67439_cov47-Cyclotella_meneghiniana.AAC.1